MGLAIMERKTIVVATDFSRYPGGRYSADGPNSGERFRAEFLGPALAGSEKVVVVLDDVRGYGSSFLEEAFGGLVRHGVNAEELLGKLELVSKKDNSLIVEIRQYVEDQAKRQK